MVGYTLPLFLPLLCAFPYVNVQLKYINAPDAILLIFIFFSFITFGYHQVSKYGNMILTLRKLYIYIYILYIYIYYTYVMYIYVYMIRFNGFLRIPRNNHNKDHQY